MVLPKLVFLVGSVLSFFCLKSLLGGTVTADYRAAPIVLPAPLLTVMYGGDRYLAANVERLSLSTKVALLDDASSGGDAYFSKALQVVSQLNGCHEDNYYMANGILAWGDGRGAFPILQSATDCRYWDEWPPFYLGYNYHFFRGDNLAAARYMAMASERTQDFDNKRQFKKIALVFEAGTKPNVDAAIQFLVAEYRGSKDEKLRVALKRRIGRLEGLKQLQAAGDLYKKRFGRPVRSFQDLVDAKIMLTPPKDPLGRGYDLVDGTFKLHSATGK